MVGFYFLFRNLGNIISFYTRNVTEYSSPCLRKNLNSLNDIVVLPIKVKSDSGIAFWGRMIQSFDVLWWVTSVRGAFYTLWHCKGWKLNINVLNEGLLYYICSTVSIIPNLNRTILGNVHKIYSASKIL